MSDAELIEEYHKGNDAALEKLINRYISPIFNFVSVYIHDKQSAEDITQEVFVKMWRHLKRFDVNKNFKTWLYTIAKRTAWDFLRKYKIMPSSLTEEVHLEQMQDTATSPSEKMKVADRQKLVQLALEKLPILYQEVLNLYYIEDLNFREIAEVLNESINTVKSRHRRGLIMIKKLISLDDAPKNS